MQSVCVVELDVLPAVNCTKISSVAQIYRVCIKSFLDYKHLLQENYVEYEHFFFQNVTQLKKYFFYKLTYVMVKKYICIPRSFLVINFCNEGKTSC